MADPIFIQQGLMKFSSKERLKLYELTSVLAEDDEQFTQDDYLEMYLLGARDWEKDYERLKKRRPQKGS